MKKRITTHAILLAILLLDVGTQARSSDLMIAATSLDGGSVNVKDTQQEVKDESAGYDSVVQDWNLVCEQLCRAGLGGPSCAPHCDIITKTYQDSLTQTAQNLLGDHSADICSILCLYELGEISCTCTSSRKLSPEQQNRDIICKSFCVLGNVTLSGCSVCTIQSSSTNITMTSTNTKVSYMLDPGFQPQSAIAVAAGDAAVAPASTASTTPDWNEVCLSLCKIGEGGSLCNCDLPPFF